MDKHERLKALEGLAMGLQAGCNHQAFEHRHTKAEHMLMFEVLARHLQQQGRFIIFGGTFGHQAGSCPCACACTRRTPV
jgi:hypothetical protein